MCFAPLAANADLVYQRCTQTIDQTLWDECAIRTGIYQSIQWTQAQIFPWVT